MNTLKYKVLLVKTGLLVFIRALGIYLLMTIPAVAALPLMYLLSAGFALSFGWIAAVLFLFLFYLLQITKMDIMVKTIFLYASVAIAVAVAFQMMEVTGAEDRIWQSGGFLLFPAAAVVSGWISLAVSRQKISSLLALNDTGNYAAAGNSISSTPENML